MPDGFEIKFDECAVTLCFLGHAIDLHPNQARELGQQLIERAGDCEDAQELETQMMG